MGIVDADGNKIVEYKYDSWGKLLSCYCVRELMLGFMNPFRYRGYVYDEETGLYYLRSRYYNPVWGRFVNSDSLAGQIGDLFSHNTFLYCLNRVTTFSDPDGFFPEIWLNGKLVITSEGIATPYGNYLNKLQQVIGRLISMEGKNKYAEKENRGKRKNVANGWSDCSSLTQWAFKKEFGIDIGSHADDQAHNKDLEVVDVVEKNDIDKVTNPPIELMRPGDLVYFSASPKNRTISHVEVYLGDGMIIGHGGDMGPTIKNLNDHIDYRLSKGYGGYRGTNRIPEP